MTLKIGKFQLQTQRAYGIPLGYISFDAPETILGWQVRIFY